MRALFSLLKCVSENISLRLASHIYIYIECQPKRGAILAQAWDSSAELLRPIILKSHVFHGRARRYQDVAPWRQRAVQRVGFGGEEDVLGGIEVTEVDTDVSGVPICVEATKWWPAEDLGPCPALQCKQAVEACHCTEEEIL